MTTNPSATAYPGSAVYPDGPPTSRVALLERASAAETGTAHSPAIGATLLPGTKYPGTLQYPDQDSSGVTQLYLAETATGTDALSVAVSVAVAETAALSDLLVQTLYKSLAETPAGTDSLAVWRQSGYDIAVWADSPSGYWPLDENPATTGLRLLDWSGGGHHAEEAGASPLWPPVLPDGGYSMRNGVGNYGIGYVPSGAWMNQPTAFSVECWFKAETLVTRGGLVSRWDQGAAGGWSLNTVNNQFEWCVQTPGADNAVVSAGTSYPAGTVCHVVGTYDGSTARLYVNGVLRGSAAVSRSTGTTSKDMQFGSYNGFENGTFFDGYLDAVAFYPTTLSAGRVSAHYSAGTGAGTSVGLTETASASDALSVAAAVALGADTAAATDDLLGRYPLILPGETGVASESFSASITAALTLPGETGSGSDELSASVTAPLTLPDDAATGTDELSVALARALAETASGTDEITIIGTAYKSLPGDSATGTEDLGWISTNPTDYSTRVLADHPLAYYRLNEGTALTSHDQSGNHYDGTWSRAPRAVSDGALAEADGALTVPIVAYSPSQCVAPVPVAAALDSFSIEAWVRQNHPGTSMSAMRVLASAAVPTDTENKFALHLFDINYVTYALIGGTRYQSVIGAPDPRYGHDWTHVVGVYDGQKLATWCDGQLSGEQTAVRGRVSATPGAVFELANSAIVSSHWQPLSFYPGLTEVSLDEVAYYQAPLHPARISVHHLTGRGELSVYREIVLIDEPACFYSLLWLGDTSYGGYDADLRDLSGHSITGSVQSSTTLSPAIGGEASAHEASLGGPKALVGLFPNLAFVAQPGIGSMGIDVEDPAGFTVDFWYSSREAGSDTPNGVGGAAKTAQFVQGFHRSGSHSSVSPERLCFYLTGTGRVGFAAGGDSLSDEMANITAGSVKVNDGKWHHIGLRYDYDGAVTYTIGIYVDGLPDRVGAFTGPAIVWHEYTDPLFDEAINWVNFLAEVEGAVTSIATFQTLLSATRIKAHWRAGVPGAGTGTDVATLADALSVFKIVWSTKTLAETASASDALSVVVTEIVNLTLAETATATDASVLGLGLFLDEFARGGDALTREPPAPDPTGHRSLASFTAAGRGSAGFGPVADGVSLSGFTAAGRGGLGVEPAPGARTSGFTAAGQGGMQAYNWALLVGSFTAAGRGRLVLARRLGGDELNPDGPDLNTTDPLRIALTLRGAMELWPPELDDIEDMYDTGDDDAPAPAMTSRTQVFAAELDE